MFAVVFALYNGYSMVSRTLGHSNISVTLNKYSYLLPKHQKACMEKLEAIYYSYKRNPKNFWAIT